MPTKERTFADELSEALRNHSFSTFEELQTFANEFLAERNHAARDAFQGLSPEIMYDILYHPFASPHIAEFPTVLNCEPVAPVITMMNHLAEAAGESGMKATAKGNLPLAVCKAAAPLYYGDEYETVKRWFRITTELDFMPVHTTRIIAEMAGLLRKYKGRFVLTKKYRMVLNAGGPAGIYPLLLRSFLTTYNWAYYSRLEEFRLIQDSAVFSLYLLNKFGSEWRPEEFYEDSFLRAFPMIVDEVVPSQFYEPVKIVRACYTQRCLHGFMRFFGLAEFRSLSKGDIITKFEIRKTPLFHDAVHMHIASE